MTNSTNVLFVRHGESSMNEQNLFCGWSDSELTPKGKEQAELVAKKLEDIEMDLIISSDLKRCVDTAKIINKFKNTKLILEKGIREINFGDWEGLGFEDIKSKYPDQVKEWEKDYINFAIPNGESLIEMYERVNGYFEDKIKEYNNKNILIVAHSGVIRGILCKQLCGDISSYWKFKIDNCGIIQLEITDGFPVLCTLNR